MAEISEFLQFYPTMIKHYRWILGFGNSLKGCIGIPFKSSEYVILKWFSSSSFGTSCLPLFDSSNFFFESIRIWLEYSPSVMFFFRYLLWFSALEIPRMLFWISFRIFWSSNLSWIGASFNGRLSFYVPIITFPSIPVVYSVVFLLF